MPISRAPSTTASTESTAAAFESGGQQIEARSTAPVSGNDSAPMEAASAVHNVAAAVQIVVEGQQPDMQAHGAPVDSAELAQFTEQGVGPTATGSTGTHMPPSVGGAFKPVHTAAPVDTAAPMDASFHVDMRMPVQTTVVSTTAVTVPGMDPQLQDASQANAAAMADATGSDAHAAAGGTADTTNKPAEQEAGADGTAEPPEQEETGQDASGVNSSAVKPVDSTAQDCNQPQGGFRLSCSTSSCWFAALDHMQ